MSVTQQRATHNDELRHSTPTLTALSGGAPRAARPTPITIPPVKCTYCTEQIPFGTRFRLKSAGSRNVSGR